MCVLYEMQKIKSCSMLQRSLWHQNKINRLLSKPLPGTSKIQFRVSNHKHVAGRLSTFQRRLICRSSLLTQAANQTADTQSLMEVAECFSFCYSKEKNNWTQEESDMNNEQFPVECCCPNEVRLNSTGFSSKYCAKITIRGALSFCCWLITTRHCVSLLKQTISLAV